MLQHSIADLQLLDYSVFAPIPHQEVRVSSSGYEEIMAGKT
jgi:hypothetical protein